MTSNSGAAASARNAASVDGELSRLHDQGASYLEYFHSGPTRGPWWLDSSQAALDAYRDVVRDF